MSEALPYRLVVTDMDGTLLDGAGRLPAAFPAAVRALAARGIHWVIASGRQLANLQAQFQGVEPAPDIVAENGALAQIGGESAPFFRDLTPPGFFVEILRAAAAIPGATPVLCGVDCAWVADAYPENLPEVARYFSRTAAMSPAALCAGAPGVPDICKVAIYHRSAGEVLWPRLSPLGREDLRVIHSSPCWIDVQAARINKGRALAAILAHRGLAPAQAVVFGDYLNDTEMMTLGTHAVAMANAHPQLRALCPYTAPANTANGVLVYLAELGLLPAGGPGEGV